MRAMFIEINWNFRAKNLNIFNDIWTLIPPILKKAKSNSVKIEIFKNWDIFDDFQTVWDERF